jgi:hypothetical protein
MRLTTRHDVRTKVIYGWFTLFFVSFMFLVCCISFSWVYQLPTVHAAAYPSLLRKDIDPNPGPSPFTNTQWLDAKGTQIRAIADPQARYQAIRVFLPQLVTNLLHQATGPNVVFTNKIPGYVAYFLALEIQAFRQYQNYTGGYNYGDALYYTTDVAGNPASVNFVLPQPARGVNPPGGQHSEVTLIDSMQGVISNGLRKLNNCNIPNTGHVTVVIYSQRTMCTDCLAHISLVQNTISNMLYAGAAGATITVTGWSALNQTWPIVMYPGTVTNSADIKNDYYA